LNFVISRFALSYEELIFGRGRDLADAQEEVERIREQIAVMRAQSGDRDAFGQLVARYGDRLMYYVYRLIDDREHSRDVLQETWLEVFRTLGRLEAPAAFRVWLYRVAHHRAMSHLRQRVARWTAEEHAAIQNSDLDSWNELDLLDSAELVHFALAKLSPVHREVMTLRFMEDMDIRDIARVMDCSEGTAKSRLHYAKAALKRIIDEEQGHG
jgi:RNA polymerase sigma-70 factor (ECF subfamily)